MPDVQPVPRDLESLKAAIRSAGRAPDSDEQRASVIRAAAELGHSDLIPDVWRADGTLRVEQRDTANDVFAALDGAVSDTSDYYTWVQDWYGSGSTDDPYTVVYQSGGDMYAAEFSYDAEDKVVLGEPAKVRPVTSYVERSESPEIEYRRIRAETLKGLREVRRFDVNGLEVRETTDGMLRFSGYASVTETPYEVGDFAETISRGAFKRTLNEDPDVVLLVNHGEGGGLPLARTKSGTMTLAEDARGLRVDADLNPNDPDVRALVPKLERGDVDEMSFAFRVTDQTWSDDYTKRTIRGVALHKGDVSIVTHGANDASTGGLVSMRSTDGTVELRAGKAISAANQTQIQRVLDLVAAADEAVDEAQPILADLIDVPNPDADESNADRAIVIPDHTTRARQRLLALRSDR